MPRVLTLALLVFLAANALSQAPAPTTEQVLDNPVLRVYRANIPAHQSLKFQELATW